VKKSRAVELILLASAAAGCGRRQCVDERDIVVEDRYCQPPYPGGGAHGYRFYNGGFFGSSTPVGSSVRNSGTIRGVFGGSGEAAHGAGGGAGE
jgi:hypothetical protein